LIKLGIDVTAIQFDPGGREEYIHPLLNCRVIPLPLKRPALVMNWLWAAGKVQEIVEGIGPEVVHIQAVPELGVRVTRPRVLTIHGNSPRDEWLVGGRRRYFTTPIVSFTFWWCRRKYKQVIVISPYTRKIGGFSRRACLVDIPNAVEDAFFDVRRETFAPRVLVVGALSALKNTLGVVQTASKLRRLVPDVQFRVAGPWARHGYNPAYRTTVEQFCRKEDLSKTVVFLGPKSREELQAELSKAACLFLPSFQENAPMVIAEAMAAGVPVAASRVGGIPWMVEEGVTGFLFDPHNLDQMVECLHGLLKDARFNERTGQLAHQAAEGRYRAHLVAGRTIEVYEQAIRDARQIGETRA
jgi:glycosyltransferase involved in cell wall biosynthesis